MSFDAETKLWIAVYAHELSARTTHIDNARPWAIRAATNAAEDLRAWQRAERERRQREAQEALDRQVWEWSPKLPREAEVSSRFDGPTLGESVERVMRVLAWMLDADDLSRKP